MEILELVKQTKLDRITGTRSIVRTDGSSFTEIDESTKKKLEELDSITGKTLYLIEHGCSQVIDFLDNLEENNSPDLVVTLDDSADGGWIIKTVDFGDFKIYEVINSTSPRYFKWWGRTILMDVRKVDLPYLKQTTLSKVSRIYIAMDDSYGLYKFPSLMYPSPIKDFFKWLKKKKKISVKIRSVFDRNETFESYSGWMMKRNIKSESEIPEYIQDVKNNDKHGWYGGWIRHLENVKDITITQDDINLYISEANNRYKVYR